MHVKMEFIATTCEWDLLWLFFIFSIFPHSHPQSTFDIHFSFSQMSARVRFWILLEMVTCIQNIFLSSFFPSIISVLSCHTLFECKLNVSGKNWRKKSYNNSEKGSFFNNFSIFSFLIKYLQSGCQSALFVIRDAAMKRFRLL